MSYNAAQLATLVRPKTRCERNSSFSGTFLEGSDSVLLKTNREQGDSCREQLTLSEVKIRRSKQRRFQSCMKVVHT